MRTLRSLAFLLSFPPTLLAVLGAPASSAWAAEPSPPVQKQVQPVPYAISQPVPYASPSGSGAQSPPLPPPPAVAVVTGMVAAGNDVVVLKQGGMIRGTLLEVIPDDHATVQLATGQSAVIQWDHIERIDRAKVAPAPAAPAPVVRVDPRIDATRARVHIESDRAVTLERHDGGKTWSFACAAPCDAPLSIEPEYRIVGDGVRKSAPFHLAARPGEAVTLDVNTATKSGFAGGIVLTALGPVVMIVGLMIVAVAGWESQTDYLYSASGGTTSTTTDHSGARTAGWITVLAGGIGTVGGILMITGNAHSSVDQAIPRRDVARNDAWKRLPTFHDDPNALATPRGIDIPLLGGSF